LNQQVSKPALRLGLPHQRMRVIEDADVGLGITDLFGNHQDMEVRAQSGALQTHTLQFGKPVGDDA
jgi:hypothetical protein